MAANPDQKKLREVNMTLKIKTEELDRLREEVKELRSSRNALRESLGKTVKAAAADQA